MNVLKVTNKEELIGEIVRSVESIRYGYVQIVIQDSKVVQIDRTEKVRFDKGGRQSTGAEKGGDANFK